MNLSSGHEVVDYIGKMNFTGNVTPHIWYKTILKENGHTNYLAITILSDIVYWYRPEEIRDEATGQLLGYRKKFKADALQRSYAQLAEEFGCSTRQALDAIINLEQLGVVKRDLRTIEIGNEGRKVSNVMFLLLNPERLYELTYPANTDNGDSCPEKTGHPLTLESDSYPENPGQPLPEKRDTYTKNTYTENSAQITDTENTTEISLVGSDPSILPSAMGSSTSNIQEKDKGLIDIKQLDYELNERKIMFSQMMKIASYEQYVKEVRDNQMSASKAKKRAVEYLKLHLEFSYIEQYRITEIDDFKAIIEYMAEVISAKTLINLFGTQYEPEELGRKYFELNMEDVMGVLDRFAEMSSRQGIVNKRKYLLAMLLHAKEDGTVDCLSKMSEYRWMM